MKSYYTCLVNQLCTSCRLEEACTNIAAVISCLIRASELRANSGATACTSKECAWLPIAWDVSIYSFSNTFCCGYCHVKCLLNNISSLKVTPIHVFDIHFTPKWSSSSTSLSRKSCRIEPPTGDELDAFYKTLNSSRDKPASLKITLPYSKQFIPLLSQASVPFPLSQFYDPDALGLKYLELLSKCEEVLKTMKVKVASERICGCVLYSNNVMLHFRWPQNRSKLGTDYQGAGKQ